jgi:hypothetical protein
MGCGPCKSGPSTGPPWTSQWPAAGAHHAVEAREAKQWCGDPGGGLTLGEEAVWWASGGGAQSSAAALGVRGAQGEESWGAWCGGVMAGAALYMLEEEGRRSAGCGMVG